MEKMERIEPQVFDAMVAKDLYLVAYGFEIRKLADLNPVRLNKINKTELVRTLRQLLDGSDAKAIDSVNTVAATAVALTAAGRSVGAIYGFNDSKDEGNFGIYDLNLAWTDSQSIARTLTITLKPDRYKENKLWVLTAYQSQGNTQYSATNATGIIGAVVADETRAGSNHTLENIVERDINYLSKS